MVTIHLCAIDAIRGTSELHASIRKERVFGPDEPEVEVLFLSLGDGTIRLWPADPDRIEELGEKLVKLAETQRSKGKRSYVSPA